MFQNSILSARCRYLRESCFNHSSTVCCNASESVFGNFPLSRKLNATDAFAPATVCQHQHHSCIVRKSVCKLQPKYMNPLAITSKQTVCLDSGCSQDYDATLGCVCKRSAESFDEIAALPTKNDTVPSSQR